MYISHPRARRAHRNCPTYIHPPKSWHDISNTNICLQLSKMSQTVSCENSLLKYIFKNIHIPTPRPKGAQKLVNSHLSPRVGVIYLYVACMSPVCPPVCPTYVPFQNNILLIYRPSPPIYIPYILPTKPPS